MPGTTVQASFLGLNESLAFSKTTTPPTDYDMNDSSVYYPMQEEQICLYQETQLERAGFEEEGYYELELFTHYLSGFGGLSLAIIGLVLNSFAAFTLCRAAVFRAHLIFLCAVAIADALQLSCLIVIITRDIRQPDPRYLNMLPRIYIRVFLYLYPLSKFFHLAMAWLVMASSVDCWRWIRKAQIKEEMLKARLLKRRSMVRSSSSYSEFMQKELGLTVDDVETKATCRVIVSEILVIIAIALLALIYTIPSAWENKGDILLLGKIGTDTNCTAFVYHLMQTDLSQTALYRIGYSLVGHLIFQTGMPLVVSSIAIAKISRQLQLTSSSLGQLVTDAVQLVMRSGGIDRQQLPSPTYSQRIIVENRNIIHCSLFLSVFTFYVCHVPQLWAKIQWSLMHVESHQNSHMKYVNEFVNFMTVANAAVNGFFILCFCRRYIADGARDIDMCAWCFPPKDGSGGGFCSKGDPTSGSSDQDEQEDVEYAEQEDAGQNHGNKAQIVDETYTASQPNAGGGCSENVGILRHKSSPNLGGRGEGSSNVATICDGQLLLDSNNNNDVFIQQPSAMQQEQPQRHHRHHHKHHRHNRHNSLDKMKPIYFSQDGALPQYYDVDFSSQQQPVMLGDRPVTVMPSIFHLQQQQQQQKSSNHPQQYFTMGPQDSDIYVAAQV